MTMAGSGRKFANLLDDTRPLPKTQAWRCGPVAVLYDRGMGLILIRVVPQTASWYQDEFKECANSDPL
jgi:hypothetical protein